MSLADMPVSPDEAHHSTHRSRILDFLGLERNVLVMTSARMIQDFGAPKWATSCARPWSLILPKASTAAVYLARSSQ